MVTDMAKLAASCLSWLILLVFLLPAAGWAANAKKIRGFRAVCRRQRI
jgi:hypothetical protein